MRRRLWTEKAKHWVGLIVVGGGWLLAPNLWASCGSAVCAVNTNWEVQGGQHQAGTRLDLRYEYIEQNQLRHNHQTASPAHLAGDHDETYTINRNFILGIDHALNSDWSLSVHLPVINRSHLHTRNGTEALSDGHDHGAFTPSSGVLSRRLVAHTTEASSVATPSRRELWHFTSLGDFRLQARYRLNTWNESQVTLGLLAGIKWPTGATKLENDKQLRAERSLQPGTGSTDSLAGVYLQQAKPQWGVSWFTQALWQSAMTIRDHYRPGNQVSLDFGGRYALGTEWSALLQFNVLIKGRDRGMEAEAEDSGGEFVFMSPGILYAWNSHWQFYGFMQAPLSQRFNGHQLTARGSVALGSAYRF